MKRAAQFALATIQLFNIQPAWAKHHHHEVHHHQARQEIPVPRRKPPLWYFPAASSEEDHDYTEVERAFHNQK